MVGCHAQLEGEGTGEDGGQVDGILANEGPIHGRSPRLDSEQAIATRLGWRNVLVDNVGDLEMRQVSQEPSVRGGIGVPQ